MFSYERLSPNRRVFIDKAIEIFPDLTDRITVDQIEVVYKTANINRPQWFYHPDNRVSRGVYSFPRPDIKAKPQTQEYETEDQVIQRINNKYSSMENLIKAVAANTVNSLVITGAPGLGKSYTANEVLHKINNGEYGYIFHRGNLKATHLFRLLWENRMPGQVIVLDDVDLWADENSLNMLKSALELKPVRRIGWGSEKEFEDQDGEQIPRYFDYEGSIIFLTNLDIYGMIAANTKNSVHLSAIESRSLVLDLGIRNKAEALLVVKEKIKQGMLNKLGLDAKEQSEILSFIETNMDRLREVSLRMLEKISILYKAELDWKIIRESVCNKT